MRRRREEIRRLGPADAAGPAPRRIAALLDPRSGPGWSAASIAGMLRTGGLDGFAAFGRRPGAPLVARGCLLFRAAADEGEILSVAVRAADRRRGLAAALLRRALRDLAGRGVRRVFLDVAADNRPALALYRAAGFAVAGKRRNYYAPRAGKKRDALAMRRDFAPAGRAGGRFFRNRVFFSCYSRLPGVSPCRTPVNASGRIRWIPKISKTAGSSTRSRSFRRMSRTTAFRPRT